jgi:hypothetical protein
VYQPMSVVITAFKETDVKNALKGFGVLVPRKEQKNGFFTLGKSDKISCINLLPQKTIVCQQFCHGLSRYAIFVIHVPRPCPAWSSGLHHLCWR